MRFTLTCLLMYLIFIVFTTDRSRKLKYDDCGSLFEIVDVTFYECRGYLCPINMKGEQEITINFKTNGYPFASPELYHIIYWLRKNETNYITVEDVICDGNDECSLAPRNGIHVLVASFYIPHELTNYGVFYWEVFIYTSKTVLCLEAKFFDSDSVKPEEFHLL